MISQVTKEETNEVPMPTHITNQGKCSTLFGVPSIVTMDKKYCDYGKNPKGSNYSLFGGDCRHPDLDGVFFCDLTPMIAAAVWYFGCRLCLKYLAPILQSDSSTT